LTTEAAAQLLGLERRQSVSAVEGQSDRSPNRLISKRRGRRSTRRKPEALGA